MILRGPVSIAITFAVLGTPLSNARGVSRAPLAKVLLRGGLRRNSTRSLPRRASLSMLTDTWGRIALVEPQPTWAAAFRVMWNKLLDDVVACGCYSAGEAQACASF